MKTFSHMRPVRDASGSIVGQKAAPVSRVTREELGGEFGPDQHRQLVVTLEPGDVICFRPKGTRQSVRAPAAWLYVKAIEAQVEARRNTRRKGRASC
jgi:hypothetical protein